MFKDGKRVAKQPTDRFPQDLPADSLSRRPACLHMDRTSIPIRQNQQHQANPGCRKVIQTNSNQKATSANLISYKLNVVRVCRKCEVLRLQFCVPPTELRELAAARKWTATRQPSPLARSLYLKVIGKLGYTPLTMVTSLKSGL